MKAFLVVDMQKGMHSSKSSPSRLDETVQRINRVANDMRRRGFPIIFIQHAGPEDSSYLPQTEGWELLNELEVFPTDVIVEKTMCDSFYETSLNSVLQSEGVTEVVVAGWATDFCVDTTIRSAASHGMKVVVLADAHVVADREHLSANQIVEHHNAIWRELIVPNEPIRVIATEQFLTDLD